MKLIGLKFILTGPSFVSVVEDESLARRIITDWMSGAFKLKGTTIIGDANRPDGGWAVTVDAIQAIHTFVLEVQEMPPAKTNLGQFGGKFSRSGN